MKQENPFSSEEKAREEQRENAGKSFENYSSERILSMDQVIEINNIFKILKLDAEATVPAKQERDTSDIRRIDKDLLRYIKTIVEDDNFWKSIPEHFQTPIKAHGKLYSGGTGREELRSQLNNIVNLYRKEVEE